MKWMFNDIYIKQNQTLFILFLVLMLAIFILTIVFVNKELGKQENDNK